ncbi:MAG: ACT domain-containing protein [Clostridia bacterium]|nr:ACT domain-containing protein [Clostridia bacterium]
MKVIISVLGKDTVGILAKASGVCADCNANILEVAQNVLGDVFAMTMIADIDKLSVSFDELSDRLNAMAEEMGLSVRVMHEDIFNSMHRI